MSDTLPTTTPCGRTTTGDLWRWVDRLTRDRRHRLIRHTPGGTPRVQYVDIPSLWTQLLEALASTDSPDGRPGKNTGSRSPLDLAIETLLTDMSTDTRRGLLQHGGRPRILQAVPVVGPGRATPPLVDEDGRPLIDPEQAGRLTEAAARASVIRDTARLRHDVHTDLRQLAALIAGLPHQDLIDSWADRYRTWVTRAEDILTGDEEAIELRGIRGHACPNCGHAWVERVEPSTDPRAVSGVERFRDPALVIAFRDGQVQHVTCRACSTGWWRGDDVERLGAKIRDNMPAADRAPRGGEGQRAGYGEINAGGRLSGRRDDWWPWPGTGGSAA